VVAVAAASLTLVGSAGYGSLTVGQGAVTVTLLERGPLPTALTALTW